MFKNEKPAQCSVQSSHIPFNKGRSFLMSLANETDGGRLGDTSFSVNVKWMPPANVMERVGSGVRGKDTVTGVGDEAVDNSGEIGAWGCVAAPAFAALFQKGMGGSTTLDGASTC
jgi:hypothetical protein